MSMNYMMKEWVGVSAREQDSAGYKMGNIGRV